MTKNKVTTSLEYLDDFLLNLQTNNYSQETVYNYERDLKLFEDFLSEIEVPFKKVDKPTINHYKAYLTSIDRRTAKGQKGIKKLESRSINRFLSTLRSYLKYLIEMDYPSPLPSEAVKLVKTERKHPRVAELKDLIRLI